MFYTTFCFLSNIIINCQEQLKAIQQTEKKKKYTSFFEHPAKSSEPSKDLRSNINHYFTLAVISNVLKNSKSKNNLEASYLALWKPDLNEQNDFETPV